MIFDPHEWASLEARITAWACGQDEVRAAILSGSRTRKDPPADEWSDLDVMLFVPEVEALAKDTRWLEKIGQTWLVVPWRTGGNDPEALVTFAGGYNVDFVFVHEGGLDYLISAETLPEPFSRGYRVLVDKTGKAGRIPPAPGAPPPAAQPLEEAFNRLCSLFWYHAFGMAKLIRREDWILFRARQAQMVEMLVKIMEMHAVAVRKQADTFHMGRFIERWGDPRALQSLPEVFTGYGVVESWRSLLGAMEIFRRLSQETAQALNVTYPRLVDENITRVIDRMLEEG